MKRRLLLYSPNLDVLEGEFLSRALQVRLFRAIVPTRAWADRLDRELLGAGLPGLCDSPVLTFELTVDWALRRAREEDMRKVTSQPERLFLMKAAISKVYRELREGGRFGTLVPFAGFASEMLSLAAMLKEARVSIEMLFDAGAALRRDNLEEVAQILSEYVNLTRRLGAEDEQDAYERLLELPPSRLPEIGTLFVLGFHDLTELQFAVVKRLSERAEEAVFLVPFDPERPDLFEFALPTFERLSKFCKEVRPLDLGFDGNRALSRLRSSFLGRKPERGQPDDSIALIEASGATQEVEAVAREIRNLRRLDPSIPWGEFAVLYRSSDPYLSLIEEAFLRYSIPLDAAEGPSLLSTGLGRAFCHLLLGRAQDFDREFLLSSMKSGYVRLALLEEALDEIDIRMREQGVTKGKEEWLKGLRQAARRLEWGMEEAKRTKGEEEKVATIEALRQELSRLLGHLSAVPDRAPWPLMVEKIASYIRPCISPKPPSLASPISNWHLRRDLQAEEALDYLLHSLLLASSVAKGVETSISEAAGLMVHLMGRTRLPPASVKGDVVKVLHVEGSRGHKAKYAFILGLLEKLFPAEPLSDPFVPDTDREKLMKRFGVKMPKAMQRPSEEDLFFFLVTQIPADRLYLCYPATDPEGKPNVASRYVEEALTILTRPYRREVDEAKVRRISLTVRDVVPRRPSEVLPSVEASFSAEEAGTAALLLAHEAGEVENASAFLASDEAALYGLKVELKRCSSNKGPCEWSGAVGATPLVAERWNAIFFEGMSPTALEEFGKCPFVYFVRHVVRAEEIEEAAIPISFKERGRLVHQILAEFVKRRIERCSPPLTKAELKEAQAELVEIAHMFFEEAESQGRVGHPEVWKVEKESIKQLLLCSLEGEPRLQQEEGATPAYVEIGFGPMVEGRPHPTVRLDGDTEVPLRGFIDRVDIGPDGFRVIDYKTGSERQRKNIERGYDFQLWAYVKAATLITGLDPKSAFYLLVTKPTRAGGARRCVVLEFPKDWALTQQAEQRCKEHLTKIREGLFPTFPGSASECRNCPFKRVCRFDRVGRGGAE